MAKKTNFLIYKDWGKSVNKLDDVEAGKLFKSLFKYVNGRNKVEFENLGTDMLYGIIIDSLERDLIKYKETCEKNKINGKKGGRPKKQEVKTETKKTQVVIKETEGLFEKPKKADIDIDNDIDIDIETEIDKDKQKNIKKVDYINLIERIIDYLNKRSSREFKYTTKKTQTLIKARLREGFTEQDFYTVIDKKVYEWHNDSDMQQFIRPETLFGTKFEGYLNSKVVEKKKTVLDYKLNKSWEDIWNE